MNIKDRIKQLAQVHTSEFVKVRVKNWKAGNLGDNIVLGIILQISIVHGKI